MAVPDFTVSNVTPSRICRCGSYHDLGFASVKIGDLTIRVSFNSDGLRWPDAVSLSPCLQRQIGPQIEREWLRQVGEAWAKARGAAGGAA